MTPSVDLKAFDSDQLSTVEIYTDGSCLRNPGGPGGWAAILPIDGEMWLATGWAYKTTNNRMELTAAIEGLCRVPLGFRVRVFSDSEYLVKTMSLGWKRRKNKDLWERLDNQVAGREVSWEWVKAHAGHPLNEMADRSARKEAMGVARGEKKAAQEGEVGFRKLPSPLEIMDETEDKGERTARPDSGLTHVDKEGKGSMVDVGDKEPSDRMAVAEGRVRMAPQTLALIKENAVKKGDVLGIAMVAGITGSKATSTLIPLCHPLPLDQVTVDFELNEAESSVEITAMAKTHAKTGVEMEALTAVTVAALTIYDMCKATDKQMRIEAVRLVRKTGGRSGDVDLE